MDPAAAARNRRTWDAIAASFDATRRRPWAPFVDFLASLPRGALVLDAGSGNGRHALPALERGLRVVGVDVSGALARIARRRAPGLGALQGALERLPIRTGTMDAAIAAASLHHIRGRVHRLEAWREIARSLRPGGRAIASVWSLHQARFRDVAASATSGAAPRGVEPGDMDLWWTQHGLRVRRFVHLYAKDELREEAEDAGLRALRVWSERLGPSDGPDNHLALVATASP